MKLEVYSQSNWTPSWFDLVQAVFYYNLFITLRSLCPFFPCLAGEASSDFSSASPCYSLSYLMAISPTFCSYSNCHFTGYYKSYFLAFLKLSWRMAHFHLNGPRHFKLNMPGSDNLPVFKSVLCFSFLLFLNAFSMQLVT